MIIYKRIWLVQVLIAGCWVYGGICDTRKEAREVARWWCEHGYIKTKVINGANNANI